MEADGESGEWRSTWGLAVRVGFGGVVVGRIVLTLGLGWGVLVVLTLIVTVEPLFMYQVISSLDLSR